MPGWITTIIAILKLLPTIIGIIKEIIGLLTGNRANPEFCPKAYVKGLHEGLKQVSREGTTMTVSKHRVELRSPPGQS